MFEKFEQNFKVTPQSLCTKNINFIYVSVQKVTDVHNKYVLLPFHMLQHLQCKPWCMWKISNETVYFADFLDCDGSFCLQHHGEI